MKRYLDFFEPDRAGSKIDSLRHAFDAGSRKTLLLGTDGRDGALANALREAGISWREKQLPSFQPADIADADLVFIADGSSTDVSRALHACIGSKTAVIAPVTGHHCSHRTLFLVSIPKAGTHMVIRLLGLMGMRRSPDRAPRPGTWCTPVGYEYHTPCRELMANDWFDPIGRQLLLRSPVIFVYRHPLDIVVSELDWFVRPDHAFAGYLNACTDMSEQLDRLIADQSVMGTIRDRINRYVGWMNFENVVAVSYEELVGSLGGGSDADQEDAIWALQLKLHIPGSPKEYGARVYDPGSVTFSKGRIGRHVECFEERHYARIGSLEQDFMQLLGYSCKQKRSSRVMELRHRPLAVKELQPETLYTPRLVREGIMGWNIIEVAGNYFPVRQGEHITSALEAESALATKQGFVTLRDAMDAVIHGGGATAAAAEAREPTQPNLVAEGYLGFNVVHYGRQWYGFEQAAGHLDIATLNDSALEQMTKNETCVVGVSYTDVKTEILRVVMQRREGQNSEPVEEHRQCLTPSDVAAAAECIEQPRLLEENCRGFNLVVYDGKVWAAAMAAGPVDLRDVQVRERLIGEGQLLEAMTVDGARAAVGIHVLEQRVHTMGACFDEINSLLFELRQTVHATQDTAPGLEGLHSHVVETAADLDELRGEFQQAITQAKVELQGQIDDIRNIDLARLHEESRQSVSQAKSNLEERIGDLTQNTLVRAGSYITKKNR